MPIVVKDRVKTTTTTAGTGAITLGSAAAGFQAFSVIGDGNETYYTIVDVTNSTWEVGIGTYTASGTTLSRTTVLESSNSGSLVNFAAGTKDVFVTYPAERSVYVEGSAYESDTGSIFTNKVSLTQNTTLGSGDNGLSVGPITISTGISVTVPTERDWLIL